MWEYAHDADDQFDIPLPSSHAELESPDTNGMSISQTPYVNGVAELSSPELFGGLPSVPEPGDSDDTP